jgi:hypothetical protein
VSAPASQPACLRHALAGQALCTLAATYDLLEATVGGTPSTELHRHTTHGHNTALNRMPNAARATGVVQSVPYTKASSAVWSGAPAIHPVLLQREGVQATSHLAQRADHQMPHNVKAEAVHLRAPCHNPAPRQECHGQEGWHAPATRIGPEVRRLIHITQCIPGEGALCHLCRSHPLGGCCLAWFSLLTSLLLPTPPPKAHPAKRIPTPHLPDSPTRPHTPTCLVRPCPVLNVVNHQPLAHCVLGGRLHVTTHKRCQGQSSRTHQGAAGNASVMRVSS